MGEYKKPLPEVNEDTKPFWEYCRKHELRMQKCMQCGHIRFPVGIVCPRCHSTEAEWVKLSGRGKVYTFNVVHYLYHEGFADEIPYVTVVIDLEEGPSLLSNIIGCKPEQVRIDMPVEVVFEDVTDEISLYKFKPVA